MWPPGAPAGPEAWGRSSGPLRPHPCGVWHLRSRISEQGKAVPTVTESPVHLGRWADRWRHSDRLGWRPPSEYPQHSLWNQEARAPPGRRLRTLRGQPGSEVPGPAPPAAGRTLRFAHWAAVLCSSPRPPGRLQRDRDLKADVFHPQTGPAGSPSLAQAPRARGGAGSRSAGLASEEGTVSAPRNGSGSGPGHGPLTGTSGHQGLVFWVFGTHLWTGRAGFSVNMKYHKRKTWLKTTAPFHSQSCKRTQNFGNSHEV